jgi:hypothetical protein
MSGANPAARAAVRRAIIDRTSRPLPPARVNHFEIRQRSRDVMVECAIRIRNMKLSAYDTGRALEQLKAGLS